jgi:hypothetical protein
MLPLDLSGNRCGHLSPNDFRHNSMTRLDIANIRAFITGEHLQEDAMDVQATATPVLSHDLGQPLTRSLDLQSSLTGFSRQAEPSRYSYASSARRLLPGDQITRSWRRSLISKE